jgi:hypothetical protein
MEDFGHILAGRVLDRAGPERRGRDFGAHVRKERMIWMRSSADVFVFRGIWWRTIRPGPEGAIEEFPERLFNPQERFVLRHTARMTVPRRLKKAGGIDHDRR